MSEHLIVSEDTLEWTQAVSEGYLEHPELMTNHTFALLMHKDGSIEISCSRDARARPGGLSGDDYGTEVNFTISTAETPDFIVALQAWCDQLRRRTNAQAD